MTESVQLALLLPMLMLMTLGVIQAGIWIHGHHVAIRAAQAGADEVRGRDGSANRAAGISAGIARSGGLKGVTVDVGRTGDQVSVTVRGTAPSMLDLPFGRIIETAWAPVEQVSAP